MGEMILTRSDQGEAAKSPRANWLTPFTATTGRRLTILVILAMLAIVVVALTGMTNNKRLADALNFSYEAITRPLAAVANARGEFNAMRTNLYDLAQDFNSVQQNRQFQQAVSDNLAGFERNIQLYKEVLDRYPTRDSYENEAVAYLHGQLGPLRDKVRELTKLGELPGRSADMVRTLRGSFLRVAEDISTDLAALTRILEAQTEAANTYAKRLRRDNDTVSLLTLAAAAIILLMVANTIVRSVTRPINEASKVLGRIALGEFDARVTGDYQGDMGVVKESVNKTAEGLATFLSAKLAAERSAHESSLAQGRAEAAKEAIVSSIHYAGKIQDNLRPPEELFQKNFLDHAVLWKPRDIVGGDIYWMKNFPSGIILSVCDCTGHGPPGALLTMLVVSALEAVTTPENSRDPAEVMLRLDDRLAGLLNVRQNTTDSGRDLNHYHDGCDLAIFHIDPQGGVKVATSNLPVFVWDGQEVRQIKGQKLVVGEGRLKDRGQVTVSEIPFAPANKFFVASDGYFDQMGGSPPRPFGYKVFRQIIGEHHHEPLAEITERMWQTFEKYRGQQPRRDDIEIIAFKPLNG